MRSSGKVGHIEKKAGRKIESGSTPTFRNQNEKKKPAKETDHELSMK